MYIFMKSKHITVTLKAEFEIQWNIYLVYQKDDLPDKVP
jgi:hypothetical protein